MQDDEGVIEAMARAITAYIDAFDAGTGTVYVEPEMRAALSAYRAQQVGL